MKSAINYWSLGGFEGEMPIAEAVALAADMGYRGLELAYGAGETARKMSDRKALQIRAACKKHGIQLTSMVCSGTWQARFSSNRKSVRQKAARVVTGAVDMAKQLGIDSLLVIPGVVDCRWEPGSEITPYSDAMKNSKASLRPVARYAAKRRVCLAVENVWNQFLLSPLEMRDFVDSFKTPWLKAYFDPANVCLTGHPEHWISVLGRRIRRVHVKNYKGEGCAGLISGFGESILKGDVDWKSVLKELKAVGYNGWLIVEMLPFCREVPAPCPELARRARRDLDKLLSSMGMAE
ncbi:MAG: sugar phosphate isomerase/epimerase family protein [Planctomycetia bacterium]|nr:sugar phosphate isomerase/epimerase family protein [Planctomycetia bacterium]